MTRLFHRTIDNVVNGFRKISILSRLICVMLCLSILPALFITWFNYFHYVAEIKSNTEQYLSLLVKNVSGQIQERLENYEYILRSFYSDSALVSIVAENETLARDPSAEAQAEFSENSHQIQKALSTLCGANRYIINLELITDTQEYLCIDSTGNNCGAMLRDAVSFRQSDYYQGALDNHGYPIWIDTTANRDLIQKFCGSTSGIGNTFTVMTAIYPPKEKDKPIGVLMMNIDFSFLSHSLTNYAFYGVGNTVLITDHVVTAFNPNTDAPSLVFDESMQELFQQMEHGEITKNIGGKNLFISFQKSRILDLYIAHIVDMDNLLSHAYKIRQLCMYILIALILVCVLVAYLTTLSLSVPLRELLDNIKAFEHSWSAKRCHVSGHDELTTISNYFNAMADSTQKMSEEIVQERLRQQTLELSRAHAELNALQMQIDPHFLYNTLDLIRWETIRIGGGENDASRMIEQFTTLLRKSIKKGENNVPISAEIEHIKAYLNVINFGRNDKIELISSFDFDPQNYLMPKLSLQPLAENAVRHGLQKGVIYPTIRLRGRLLPDQTIVITMTDNGKGMDAETLAQLKEKISANVPVSESIGLRNVNQRFLLCYGEKYGLQIDSVPNMGTDITLRLPAEPYLAHTIS